jgi:hypothetical protein
MIELDGRSSLNRKKEAGQLSMARRGPCVEIKGVNKGGVREKWIRVRLRVVGTETGCQVCPECGDEFGTGECSNYQYSQFQVFLWLQLKCPGVANHPRD